LKTVEKQQGTTKGTEDTNGRELNGKELGERERVTL